jgi:hypothetical protein
MTFACACTLFAPRPSARRGRSILDVLVAIALGGCAFAAALPLLGFHAAESGEARSHSNLRQIAAAHEAYAQTYAGRQFTAVPDDAGLVNGNCASYLATIACPSPLVLGNAANGATWGYYLAPIGFCAPFGYPGNCNNWSVYKPIEFSGVNASIGSFRISNGKALNAFVDGRFLSDVQYSPNDRRVYRTTALPRDERADFESGNESVRFSSYCLSPAAMWHEDVLSSAHNGYRDPNTFAEGYASPAVSVCAYPDLKTRVIEHNWNLNPPNHERASFDGAYTVEAWAFNASSTVSPQAIFFDGRVDRIANRQAIDDDQALFEASGQQLWSRTTPLGADGYRVSDCLDERTNHTILTIDGILGRDVLSATRP